MLVLRILSRQNLLVTSMPKRINKSNIQRKISHNKEKSTILSKKIKLNKDHNLNLNFTTMHPTENIEVLSNPLKSANDKKEYKVIRLKNGLTACLISDPSNIETPIDNVASSESESDDEQNEISETESESEVSNSESDREISEDEMDAKPKRADAEEKLAAASLCIGVGSFSDPEKIPGLAHFLEHMVFMGSEKYPQENDFDAFLKKRGGSDNASTDCETTTFYFECLEKHLAKALDKFAQFFISPLMKREAMTREREAIESEFQMALPSDAYRKEQLVASFAGKNTPVNKFVWGNLVTLRDNVSDDVLYETVHEFRNRHYSAHRMTLAIQARLPLEVLESYVIGCFSSVPNNELKGEDFSSFANNIFNNNSFKRIYYIKPVKNVCQIDLTWALPSLLHMYKSKPHQYVSWLLGHEGKGSLLSYLREKLWALAIYTGNAETGVEHNSMYALFTITLVITPEGLNHIFEIIEAVFSYINLLKEVGPQERIFNEIKTIEETSFRFKEEETAVDFVEDLAEAMHYFPPEDYLTGSALYFEYNPEAISMVVNKLSPDNLNIMVLSTTVPDHIEYNKIEPWFSTSYTDREIPKEWLERWSEVKPLNCFSLPSDNNFLATNFDLLNLSKETVPIYPEKIIDSNLVELWYKPDNKFNLPHAFMHYYFMNEMALQSAQNSCMVDLFINLLTFQLTEEAYPAHVADLNYQVTASDYGIVVKVDGYNEKLPLLLQVIIKYMKHLPENINEDLFKAVKDKQTKSYYNTFLKPSKLSRSIRLSILMQTCWPSVDKHRTIADIHFEQFKEFCVKYLSQFHVQALIQGNISKNIALETNDKIMSLLQCDPVPLDKISKIRVTELPIGKHCCKVMSFNKDDSNSIITSYYQIGPGTLKSLVTVEILMLLIEEPLFDILRTKEQLGYHVYCTSCDTYGIIGYSITVNAQAKKCTTEHVDSRINAFIKKMSSGIKRMSEKKLNQIKTDLIKVKQLVDVHLKDEVSRNWTEIVQQDFMFDRMPLEIAAIDEVKISDIKKWLENVSLGENSRKLSIQVVGYKKDDSELCKPNNTQENPSSTEQYTLQYVCTDKETSEYTFVTDTEKFKNELHLFPVHKIK